MQIFLSYASEQKHLAEPIAFSLRSQGRRVFLDKDDLPPGRNYDDQIYRAIKGSDLLVFLVSPQSVERGRYSLTELEIARRAWRHPADRVIPVMAAPTEMSAIPSFLRGVTILEPVGNLTAEVSAAVQRLSGTLASPWTVAWQAAAWTALLWFLALLVMGGTFFAIFGTDYVMDGWISNFVYSFLVAVPICFLLWKYGSQRSWYILLLPLAMLIGFGLNGDIGNSNYKVFQPIETAGLKLIQDPGATAQPADGQEQAALQQIESANRFAQSINIGFLSLLSGAALMTALLAGAAIAAPELRNLPRALVLIVLSGLVMGLLAALFHPDPQAEQSEVGVRTGLILLAWTTLVGGAIGYALAKGQSEIEYFPAV